MGRFIPLGDLAAKNTRFAFAPTISDSIKEQLKLDLYAIERVLNLIGARTLAVMHQKAEPPIAGVNENGEAAMAVSLEKEFEVEAYDPMILGTSIPDHFSRARRFTWQDVDLTCDLTCIQAAVADIPHGLHEPKVWASVLDRFIKDQILIPTAWEQTMTFAQRDLKNELLFAIPGLGIPVIANGFQHLGTGEFLFQLGMLKLFMEALERVAASTLARDCGEPFSSRIRHFPSVFGFDPLRYAAARHLIAQSTFVVAPD